jgi:hypothetical protein
VSAEIIPFVPLARNDRGQRRGTLHLFRSPARADDLVMDHADTAPCEYVADSGEYRTDKEPA